MNIDDFFLGKLKLIAEGLAVTEGDYVDFYADALNQLINWYEKREKEEKKKELKK